MLRTPRSGLNRRQLLLALGSGGVALGGARYLRAAEHTDALVLGAGLAGLNSAMLLEEHGFRVRVLEASDGPGGRVQTRTIGGRLHELGASDIGVMYARVLDMMGRLGLERVPSDIRIRPFSYYVGGALLREDEWETAEQNQTVGAERSIAPGRLESHFLGSLNPLENLDDWLLDEYRHLDIPIEDFLRQHGVSDGAIELIGKSYNGNGMQRSSALAMLRDNTRTRFSMTAFQALREAGQAVPPLSQVKGGNQRLPEAMAAALENEIRFGQAAAEVVQDANGVEVRCLDGSRHQAEFLVVALPMPALRRIDFTPALSPAKRAAAIHLDYYATTKFYLRPIRPFWESDGYAASMWTDGPIERIFAGTDENDDVHTLLVWINGIGSRRIDQLARPVAERLVLDTLARMRPASAGQLEVLGYHSWGRTPFIGGCGHSYDAGQIGAFAPALARPEGRIHFAGEHLRRTEFGMEAAMASAERTAAAILETA